jgi:hypothetical protein
MGDAFRRFFLGLGVALGLASGQPDPGIFANVSAADGAYVLYVRVENAFAPGALELVDAGTRVALRYSARLECPDGRSLEASETRALWYDMRSGFYDASFDGGKRSELVDPQAARTLVSELSGLRICRAEEAPEGGRAVIKAEIGIVDGRGEWHDAPVLWNYTSPRAVVAVGAEDPARAADPEGNR